MLMLLYRRISCRIKKINTFGNIYSISKVAEVHINNENRLHVKGVARTLTPRSQSSCIPSSSSFSSFLFFLSSLGFESALFEVSSALTKSCMLPWLAAATASGLTANWDTIGPNCPDSRALENWDTACWNCGDARVERSCSWILPSVGGKWAWRASTVSALSSIPERESPVSAVERSTAKHWEDLNFFQTHQPISRFNMYLDAFLFSYLNDFTRICTPLKNM